MSTVAAGEKKSFSDLIGDDDDPVTGGERTHAEGSREASETDGTGASTQQGENGHQTRSQRDPDGDGDDSSPRDRTTTTRNRGKTDNTRGSGRGRGRQAAGRATAELSKAERDDWRWRLRSLAGKLKADEDALQETEDRWERLLTQARDQGVPDTMLLVALMDAGVSEPDRYL